MASSLACDQMVPWKLDLFISLLILTRDILGIIMEQYLLRKQIKIHKYTRGSLILPQALMILEFASVWVPPANFPTDPLVFRISVSVISLTENRIQRKSAASSMNRQSVNPLNERKSSVRGTIKGGNETWWLIGKSKAVPSLCKLDRMGNSGLQSFCSILFKHSFRKAIRDTWTDRCEKLHRSTTFT